MHFGSYVWCMLDVCVKFGWWGLKMSSSLKIYMEMYKACTEEVKIFY